MDAPETQTVRNWKNITGKCRALSVLILLLPLRQVFLSLAGDGILAEIDL